MPAPHRRLTGLLVTALVVVVAPAAHAAHAAPATPVTAAPSSVGAAARVADPPQPAPTRGVVTGRAVDAQGEPVAGALVVGVRFSDLERPVDQSEERIVSARTRRDGRFRLPQLREPYLVRFCDPHPDTAECSEEPDVTRFARTYVGPGGTSYSWLQQTARFAPRPAGRSLGEVRLRAAAVLTGTFRDAEFRPVALARLDGSRAATAFPDERGRYRFEVAPGRYRVVADYYAYTENDSLVPGHRSRVLRLRAGRTTSHSFAARPAGTVGGRVTHDGAPVPYQPLTVLADDGEIALETGTDERGRWSVRALRPGRYTVAIGHGTSPYVPQRHEVTVVRDRPARLDLAVDGGGSVTVGVADPTGAGSDLELRNRLGQVVNTFKGDTSEAEGGAVTFPGVAPGRYTLVARRIDGPHDPELRWTSRSITVAAGEDVDLGVLTLDRDPVVLRGTAPPGAQVRLTPLPADPWLRARQVRSGSGYGTTTGLTTNANAQGRFTMDGVVPGRYVVTTSSAYVPLSDGSTVRGDYAATTSVLTIGEGAPPSPVLTTPVGREVVARLRWAGTDRPLIAPVGLSVTDGGDPLWLVPTVSERQRPGGPVRVGRLLPGPAVVRLLDEDVLYRRTESVADAFTSSSALAEPGTPYWFALPDGPIRVRVTRERVTDLGRVEVMLRGGRTVPAGATRA